MILLLTHGTSLIGQSGYADMGSNPMFRTTTIYHSITLSFFDWQTIVTMKL